MRCFLDLFTPETRAAFQARRNGQWIPGAATAHRRANRTCIRLIASNWCNARFSSLNCCFFDMMITREGQEEGAGGTGGENAKPKSLLDIVVSTGTGLGSDGQRLGVLSSQGVSRGEKVDD